MAGELGLPRFGTGVRNGASVSARSRSGGAAAAASRSGWALVNVTFANAQPLRDAAAAAPPDLLLGETDAPFLTPVPNRGRPNEPAQVAYTLRCLAEVKNIDLAALCDTVTATAARTFGPW